MSQSGSTAGAPRGESAGETDAPGEPESGPARRRRFDPRFSPAFQPGYDPRVHREAPPAAALRGEPQQDWSLSGGGAGESTGAEWVRDGRASAGRNPASPARSDAAHPLDDLPVFAVPEEPDDAAEAEPELEAEPAPWWHRINPWLIVLWALGIAILLFAFQFANAVFEGAFQPNPNDPSGYLVSMLPQMVIFGLPSLLCLGLAVFVTPFVILAARWRRA